VDVGGRTTQTGVKQAERAERLKRHAADTPLSDFGLIRLKRTWSRGAPGSSA
jgi:hypothetical protein